MAANALVTTRINESIKQEAAEVLASMGLTVSDAVRLLLTRVARDKALPFELWQPNAETLAAMAELESENIPAVSYDEFVADMEAMLSEKD